MQFISTTQGINQVLLGATVLGIGNTLSDFFANSSLASLGYGVMACTGSISGQLFNLLIGFGLNTLKIILGKNVAEANSGHCQLRPQELRRGRCLQGIHAAADGLSALLPLLPGVQLVQVRVSSGSPATSWTRAS